MGRAPGYSLPHDLRLIQLKNRLNETYGVDLAHWFDADHRAALTVSRGTGVSDVVVGVSVDDTGVFQVAVYTAVSWAQYSYPFAYTERDALERAARFVLQFVPETPCT